MFGSTGVGATVAGGLGAAVVAGGLAVVGGAAVVVGGGSVVVDDVVDVDGLVDVVAGGADVVDAVVVDAVVADSPPALEHATATSIVATPRAKERRRERFTGAHDSDRTTSGGIADRERPTGGLSRLRT